MTAGGNPADSFIEAEETYRYNERNELTERNTLSATIRYLYDENRNLVSKKEGERETSYLYYNGEILAECDGNSAPVRRHLAGQGLSHVEDIITGLTHTYHQDEQGSTTYITGSNMTRRQGSIT